MPKDKKRGSNIEVERFAQITHDVSALYLDNGDVSFATKEELCETILALHEEYSVQLEQKDKYLRDQDIRSPR